MVRRDAAGKGKVIKLKNKKKFLKKLKDKELFEIEDEKLKTKKLKKIEDGKIGNRSER